MSDLRTILERGVGGATPPPDGFERMLRRRDRKRRNQRIAAGVVGIAVFVAAVWIVTSSPFDRTQGPAVPGEIGPAVTGPTAATDAEWNGIGLLPPAGTTPSTPVEGELIAHFVEKQGLRFVNVYADGRVIWFTYHDRYVVHEQRLTPKGVDLVRSGDVPPSRFLLRPAKVFGVAGAWADRRIRTYVAPRYAICYVDEETNVVVDPSGVPDRILPDEAHALVRGTERTYEHTAGFGEEFLPATCYEVTIDDIRALVDILRNAAIYSDTLRHSAFQAELIGRGEFMFVSQRIGALGRFSIVFRPLLPQGEWIG